jgi:drug/metabolite transporter (DMT)-like permease
VNSNILIAIAILCWGLWGIFNKAAQLRIYPVQVSLIAALGSGITIPIYLYMLKISNHSFDSNFKGNCYALIGALCGAIATLAFTFSLRTESVSKVVGLTSAYPMVTFILSIFIFNETITSGKVIGLACILTGLCFLGK